MNTLNKLNRYAGGGPRRRKYYTGGIEGNPNMYSSNIIPDIMSPNTQSIYYEPETTAQQNYAAQQFSALDPTADADKIIEQQRVQNALNTQLLQTGTSTLASQLPQLIGMTPTELRASQPFTSPTTNVGKVISNPATAQSIGTGLDVGGQMVGTPDDDPYTFTGKEKAGRVMSGVGKGMSIGATIGSVVPGIGNLIGAGIGATIGGISSAFKTRKDRLAMEELKEEHEGEAKNIMENQAFWRSKEKEYSGSNTGEIPQEELLMGSEGMRGGGRRYHEGGTWHNHPHRDESTIRDTIWTDDYGGGINWHGEEIGPRRDWGTTDPKTGQFVTGNFEGGYIPEGGGTRVEQYYDTNIFKPQDILDMAARNREIDANIQGGNLTDKQVWEMNKDDVKRKYGTFEEYQTAAEKWREENKRGGGYHNKLMNKFLGGGVRYI